MTITFGAICNLLQSVENVTTRHPRLSCKGEKECIRQIISNWFSNQRASLDDPETNGGAVLSALFPHRRKDRVYGLQPPLLARKFINLLAFNHGQRALFDGWKTGAHGDLGAYTERAMKHWDGTFGNKQSISIDRIDRLLVQLAAKYRFSDESIRKQRNWNVRTDTEMKELLIRLESWEAKWLVRLILRDHCTVELDEKYVLGQFHFLLPDLLLFQDDLDAVFGMLRGVLKCYPAAPNRSEEKCMRLEAAQKLKAVVGVKVGRPTFHKAWSFKHCFQLVGKRAWAAEVKYDGEYCEIHIDLDNAPNEIKIFSKNGKDATADRQSLHSITRAALHIGQLDCLFRRKCIVLGEMVLYSDKEKEILPFSKIRKHISRSGSFIGTLQDSLPHEWEHLMIVFFDVLVLDDEPIMRRCLQDRRKVLRDLVHIVPGRSMRSEWTLLDFKTRDGITDLKQAFAQSLAKRQEGLILKPLHAPYFSLISAQHYRQASFFIKLKKDHLSDMGGERDLGDFAIIGASFDAQLASKTDFRPLHWTHFHLACCTNEDAVQRYQAKPSFKVVALVSLNKCIPKPDVKYLNIQGYLRQSTLETDGSTNGYKIQHPKGLGRRMAVAFKQPFVAEILGSGFEKVQNDTYEMLRHPRVKKIHHDRTWEDTVTIDDLERMAAEKWNVPNADKLDGHAKDVALLAKRYVREMAGSQATLTTNETTQDTTQQTTQETAPRIVRDIEILETQEYPDTLISPSPCSVEGSTQGTGIRASREVRNLGREDTSDRLHKMDSDLPTPTSSTAGAGTDTMFSPRKLAGDVAASTYRKRRFVEVISPPTFKQRKIFTSPSNPVENQHLGSFNFVSQDGSIHISPKEELRT